VLRFKDCWRAEGIRMATVDWKKMAIEKANVATDLDHEADAMKDPKDREAQVGSHHGSTASPGAQLMFSF
jgi:hypothetical protein